MMDTGRTFLLVVLFMQYVHNGAMDNKVIDQVYNELRNIVKHQTDGKEPGSDSSGGSETDEKPKNETAGLATVLHVKRSIDADAFDPLGEERRASSRRTKKAVIERKGQLPDDIDDILSLRNFPKQRGSLKRGRFPNLPDDIDDILSLRRRRKPESEAKRHKLSDSMLQLNRPKVTKKTVIARHERLPDDIDDVLTLKSLRKQPSKREKLPEEESDGRQLPADVNDLHLIKEAREEERQLEAEARYKRNGIMNASDQTNENLLSKRGSTDIDSLDGELTDEIADLLPKENERELEVESSKVQSYGEGREEEEEEGEKKEEELAQKKNEIGSVSEGEEKRNHMYHAEHGQHYIKHVASNSHDDHHNEHGQNVQGGHENKDHDREWHNYHHHRFHHVKFKLHGDGKTPSEWRQQEASELGGDQGVIYSHGQYHAVDNLPDSLSAGFYSIQCEDCLL